MESQARKYQHDEHKFWENMSSLCNKYESSHYLFNKRQTEYRKQRLKDEGEDYLDISFTLEDKSGPYFGFVGLKAKGNLVTSGELPCATEKACT